MDGERFFSKPLRWGVTFSKLAQQIEYSQVYKYLDKQQSKCVDCQLYLRIWSKILEELGRNYF